MPKPAISRGPCSRCRSWGDGIFDPDDTARWRICKVDGRNWWAHREHTCPEYKPALSLRQAFEAAELAPSIQEDRTGDVQ